MTPRLLSMALIPLLLASSGSILLAQQKGEGKEEANPNAAASDENRELPIVVVDGYKVTQLEVDRLFNARFQQRIGKLPAARVNEIRNQMRPILVDELLSKRLFLKEAKARNLPIDKDLVANTYKQFTDGFKTEEELNDYLKLINRSPEKVRQEIADEQMIQSLLKDQMKRTIKPPEPEVLEVELKKLYETHKEKFVVPEKVKARHILFAIPRGENRPEKLAPKEAEAKALRKLLVEDENTDFAAIAKAHSECPSRESGGSLGEFKRGDMVPEFEKAAFSQKVGEIGPVIKTEFGYHIIQVQAHSAPEKISFEEAKGGMAAEYLRNQQKEETTKFIQSLKAKADIEWIDQSAKSSAG